MNDALNQKLVTGYLGDGVCAQFDADADHIALRVEIACMDAGYEVAGVRIAGIALTREVFDALQKFAKRCWPEEQS